MEKGLFKFQTICQLAKIMYKKVGQQYSCNSICLIKKEKTFTRVNHMLQNLVLVDTVATQRKQNIARHTSIN